MRTHGPLKLGFLRFIAFVFLNKQFTDIFIVKPPPTDDGIPRGKNGEKLCCCKRVDGVCQKEPPRSNRCCKTVIFKSMKFKGEPFDFRELSDLEYQLDCLYIDVQCIWTYLNVE